MTALSLISDFIVPLRTSDTGEEALEMMGEFGVRHLPIVNDKQFLGLIAEDDILNFDVSEPVGAYSLSLSQPFVRDTDHLYEVMRTLAESQLTVVPVVDEETNYVGLITLENLLHYFAQAGSFAERGSILVLDISKRDYSLAEIARIVESENALVISSFITSHADSTRLEVTIKVNRHHIQSILATFNRFDYEVKASYNEAEYVDSLKERYDSLMSYLNV